MSNSGENLWDVAQALGEMNTSRTREALLKGLESSSPEKINESLKALSFAKRNDRAFESVKVFLPHPDANHRFYAAKTLFAFNPEQAGTILQKRLVVETDQDTRKLMNDLLDSKK